ncbi:meiosis-specific protein ASY2-like [Eutrema salsugineum]|uniref:meiosis-specific protein ASY2-like n=1 Tax=Eutrema salsugineum TaxID=72664 RepID=UPI000CED40EA|nr:meiosis-specific protein ASY2-like [Eutrema salsugineum]
MADIFDTISAESQTESGSREECGEMLPESSSPATSSERTGSPHCDEEDVGGGDLPLIDRAKRKAPQTRGSRGGGHRRGECGGQAGGGEKNPRPRRSKALKPPRVSYADGGSGTWSNSKSISAMISGCGFPSDVEVRIPAEDDRPWRPPSGFVCLCEAYFTRCRLRFPLPDLFVSYCHRRDLAFSQICPTTVQNMVVLLTFGSESGVDVSLDLFKDLTNHKSNPAIPGSYYASSKVGLDMTSDKPSKVGEWDRSYFYVRANETAGLVPGRSYRTDWNFSPVSHRDGPRIGDYEPLLVKLRSVPRLRSRFTIPSYAATLILMPTVPNCGASVDEEAENVPALRRRMASEREREDGVASDAASKRWRTGEVEGATSEPGPMQSGERESGVPESQGADLPVGRGDQGVEGTVAADLAAEDREGGGDGTQVDDLPEGQGGRDDVGPEGGDAEMDGDDLPGGGNSEIVSQHHEGGEGEGQRDEEETGARAPGMPTNEPGLQEDHRFDFSYREAGRSIHCDKRQCSNLIYAASHGRQEPYRSVEDLAVTANFQIASWDLIRAGACLTAICEGYEKRLDDAQEEIGRSTDRVVALEQEQILAGEKIQWLERQLAEERAHSAALREASAETSIASEVARVATVERDTLQSNLDAERVKSADLEARVASLSDVIRILFSKREHHKAESMRVSDMYLRLHEKVKAAEDHLARENARIATAQAERKQRWQAKMSQVVGTHECLMRLKDAYGLTPPPEVLEKLKSDEADYRERTGTGQASVASVAAPSSSSVPGQGVVPPVPDSSNPDPSSGGRGGAAEMTQPFRGQFGTNAQMLSPEDARDLR